MDLVPLRTHTPAAAGEPSPRRTAILLSSGFRPFFLLGSLYATLATSWWTAFLLGAADGPRTLPAAQWHGHEMVYGFAMAVVSGFLLTAVPKWTNTTPPRARTIGILVGSWTVGRLAMIFLDTAGPHVAAAVDPLLALLLAVTVGSRIFPARNRRNYGFPALLLLLAVVNALLHASHAGLIAPHLGRPLLRIGIGAVALMLVLVGGRVVPAFTVSALRRRAIEVQIGVPTWVRPASLWAVAGALVVPLFTGSAPFGGALSLVASALLARAWVGWYPHRVLGEPIVWVLHLGWLWLVTAFALQGLSLALFPLPGSMSLHALTAGAIGVMTLALMSRASLGHTGRPLRAARSTVLAYGLVTAGAFLRVAAPMLAPDRFLGLSATAGALFAAGFGIFALTHLPVWLGPRADGLPG